MSLYPKASRAQWFGDRFAGARISGNVTVWHTTETGTWPGYDGGSNAPHFTVLPIVKEQRLEFRQHFDTAESARALRNEAGGVETNTLNALQVELIGTCSRVYQDRYGYFYWPDAPEWALRQLAEFMVWVKRNHPAYEIRDAAPRGWKPYPSSYANGAGQRMTFDEWRKAYGNVGHQHVPENTHGDPGDLDMRTMVALAKAQIGEANTPVVPPKPEPKLPTKVQRARRLIKEARDAAPEGSLRRKRLNKVLRDGDLPNK